MPILGLTLDLWVVLILTAGAGGALGAALGALPALSLSGLLVLAGELTGGGLSGVGGPQFPSVIGLGPLFGPHVAFAGGVAAAAYAARKGYLDTDFEYFEAKNVAQPLGPRPDVMAVGAAFGVFGVLVWRIVAVAGLPLDPIFLSVLVSGVVHRLVLGYPLLGTVGGDGRLDLSRFDRREVAAASMGGAHLSGGGDRTVHGDRLSVEPWLPQQYQWDRVIATGIVGGLAGSYLGLTTGSVFLAFGIAAASLAFLTLGLPDVPVTHHVMLPASLAALAFVGGGGTSVPLAVVFGTTFGVLSALVAEVTERMLYAHADTHLDPAAAGIVVTTLIVGVLVEVGVLGNAAWF